MPLTPSAHVDTFARDNLPPEAEWPTIEFTIDDVRYPERLNVAVELLDRTIDRFGADRVAFLQAEGDGPLTEPAQPVRWTYGELRDRVNQVANLLVDDYGIVPGNRVLLRVPNNIWTVVLWLAVVKAGAIVVTTMVAWREIELRKVASKAKPDLVVSDSRFVDAARDAFADDPRIAVLGGEDDEIIGASLAKPTEFDAVDTAADDVVLLGPTSGTTGEPKVTMHFHRDVLANADTFAKHILQLGPDDISAGSPPLAFTFGLGGLVIFPMRTGGAGYLMEKASPVALVTAVEEHGVTVTYTAPTGYRTVLREGKAASLAKVRVAVSAGEHLPKETYEDVLAQTGIRLVNGIGSTEMLHVFISAAGDDIRPGATGVAIPGFRATLLDDEGNEVPTGEPGSLAVIGPTGCRYLDDTRQGNYVKFGWNVTGDTYIRDEEGYFFYQARSDDIIVASGYNVGAPEVEGVIDSHPDVVESAVVGRPDPVKGAVVNAFVVVRDGVVADDELKTSIQETVRAGLAPYKIPRRIDFVESLPRNPSGKLQRFPLRQRAEAEAAAEAAEEQNVNQAQGA